MTAGIFPASARPLRGDGKENRQWAKLSAEFRLWLGSETGMLVFVGFVIGAMLGLRLALRRGGNWMDMLQYGCALGIAVALTGLFLTLAAGWLGIGAGP